MSIKSLQTKTGSTPDGAFGAGTIKAAMAFYKMTPFRAAHFFGQTSHETGHFKVFSEMLSTNFVSIIIIKSDVPIDRIQRLVRFSKTIGDQIDCMMEQALRYGWAFPN